MCSLSMFAIDAIGILTYIASIIVFLAIAKRVRDVLARGESSFASALYVATIGYALYSGFVALRLLVQYELTWLKPFIWTSVTFPMRFIFLLIGLLIWRSMRPNGH